jgi:hypothetical protein
MQWGGKLTECTRLGTSAALYGSLKIVGVVYSLGRPPFCWDSDRQARGQWWMAFPETKNLRYRKLIL